jgi:hypothetical protein
VGFLDKTSAQEAQCAQDELLLYPKKCTLLADSEVEPIDDDDMPPSSTSPVATPPSHECNISVHLRAFFKAFIFK